MLSLFGVNHRSAPVEVRERLAFSDEELPAMLRRLVEEPEVAEALVLSTCNRVEVLVRASRSDAGLDAVRDFLSSERGIPAAELDRSAYRLVGLDAVRHLFHVAAGLDSMVLGEPQILGQVKQAYAIAREAGTTGPVVDHLLQRCLAGAKRARTETGISRHAVSISFAAVTLAKRIFGNLRGHAAMIHGAGKMSELALKHLVRAGVDRVAVTNRTFSRAVTLAQEFGGQAIPWEDRFSWFEKVDIVITGTAAARPVITRADVQRAVRARHGRPFFIVDIAVPRDVEPEVNALDNVYLFDIDDLHGVVDSNLDERRRAAEDSRRLIEEEVGAFARWRQAQQVAPTIAALQDHLQRIGRDEIERRRRKLASLSPEQHHAVEELTRAVVQKILHPAIRHLRSSAERGDGAGHAALFGEIFGFVERRVDESAHEAGGSDDEPSPAPDSGSPERANA